MDKTSFDGFGVADLGIGSFKEEVSRDILLLGTGNSICSGLENGEIDDFKIGSLLPKSSSCLENETGKYESSDLKSSKLGSEVFAKTLFLSGLSFSSLLKRSSFISFRTIFLVSSFC